MIVPPESRISASDSVTQTIRSYLVEGKLRPGQRVSASGVARELGISHIPVREALIRLETEGQLTRVRDKGYSVPELSVDVFDDAMHWRTIVEEEALRLIVPTVPDRVLDLLEALYASLETARISEDRSLYVRLNREFHITPFREAGSPYTIRLLEPLWDVTSHYYATIDQFPGSMKQSQADHQEMLMAYQKRDTERVIAISRTHRTVGVTRVHDALKER